MLIIGLLGVFGMNHVLLHFEEVTHSVVPAQRSLEELRFAGLHIISSTSEAGFINAEMRNSEDREDEGDSKALEEELLEHGHQNLDKALKQYLSDTTADGTNKLQTIDLTLSCWQLLAKSDELLLAIEAGEKGQTLLEIKEEFEEAEQEFLKETGAPLKKDSLEGMLSNWCKRHNVPAKRAI